MSTYDDKSDSVSDGNYFSINGLKIAEKIKSNTNYSLFKIYIIEFTSLKIKEQMISKT